MNRTNLVIFGSGVLFVVESAVFLFVPVDIPTSLISITYPPFAKLEAYCRINECLYNVDQVASLYTVQALSFLVIVAYVSWGLMGQTNRPVDSKVRAICLLVIAGAVLDYLFGNFSFDPLWVWPNNVTYSPVGIFRYAVFFWFATIASLIIANFKPPEEANDADR